MMTNTIKTNNNTNTSNDTNSNNKWYQKFLENFGRLTEQSSKESIVTFVKWIYFNRKHIQSNFIPAIQHSISTSTSNNNSVYIILLNILNEIFLLHYIPNDDSSNNNMTITKWESAFEMRVVMAEQILLPHIQQFLVLPKFQTILLPNWEQCHVFDQHPTSSSPSSSSSSSSSNIVQQIHTALQEQKQNPSSTVPTKTVTTTTATTTTTTSLLEAQEQPQPQLPDVTTTSSSTTTTATVTNAATTTAKSTSIVAQDGGGTTERDTDNVPSSTAGNENKYQANTKETPTETVHLQDTTEQQDDETIVTTNTDLDNTATATSEPEVHVIDVVQGVHEPEVLIIDVKPPVSDQEMIENILMNTTTTTTTTGSANPNAVIQQEQHAEQQKQQRRGSKAITTSSSPNQKNNSNDKVTIEIDWESKGIPASTSPIVPQQFVDPCRLIATLQIARDLRNDSAIQLSALLSSLPESIRTVIAESAEYYSTTTHTDAPKYELSDITAREFVTLLGNDHPLFDMNIDEQYENATTLIDLIQRQHVARTTIYELLVASRCQFGAHQIASTFYQYNNNNKKKNNNENENETDNLANILKQRAQILMDAMDLEGVEVQTIPATSTLTSVDDELPPFSWYTPPPPPPLLPSSTSITASVPRDDDDNNNMSNKRQKV